jgi:hypothetical protein
MPNPQRLCAFCGGLGMTKQHIFGKRLLPFLEEKAVADLSVEDDRRAIYQEDRTYLYNELAAPIHWDIFLVRADVDSDKGQYYHADAFYNTKQIAGIGPGVTKNLVVTMLLGKLCVHALSRPPTGFKGYRGVKLAALWPPTDRDIDLCGSSLLSEQE